MGESMFADMAKEWDDTCGRGIWCTLLQQRRNDLTYNQGVVLGGLVELAVADHDRFLKAAAQNIANAAIAHLADEKAYCMIRVILSAARRNAIQGDTYAQPGPFGQGTAPERVRIVSRQERRHTVEGRTRVKL